MVKNCFLLCIFCMLTQLITLQNLSRARPLIKLTPFEHLHIHKPQSKKINFAQLIAVHVLQKKVDNKSNLQYSLFTLKITFVK